jgi:hypothetical protein
MFTLITFDGNTKCTTEFDSLEEALSGARHAFDLNQELHEIRNGDDCVLLHCEIYEAIGKVIY